MKKDTQCVHSGTYADPETKGIITPIFTSSSFEYLDAPQNVYPRYFNTPNQQTIIEKLCALENAEDGLIFISGMAYDREGHLLVADKSASNIQGFRQDGTYRFHLADVEKRSPLDIFTPKGITVDSRNRLYVVEGLADRIQAFQLLRSTNEFPEWTGRLCPAPCEAACTLSINRDAVTIEQME